MAIGRLAPGGSALPAWVGSAVWSTTDPLAALSAGLERLLGAGTPEFTRSGREALRSVFAQTASEACNEIVVPAYSCFSIPAAAVAAGLRVRLVDVDARGQIDAAALAALPVDRVAALVVCNLFGIAEPIAAVRRFAQAAGVALIDDAAQALGAGGPEGAAGSRGDAGVLSFGRGKPLSALGGGALWRPGPGPELPGRRVSNADRLQATLRALAYDAARNPWVLRGLSSIPGLGIGETVFDPQFERGGIDAAALCLGAAGIRDFERATALRAQTAAALADRMRDETAFEPLLAPRGEQAVYPRLAVRAPDRRRRDAALEALFALGVSGFYPTPLGRVEALAPHLVGETELPGARDFCDRLMTLPTHGGLNGRHIDALIAGLGRLS